MKEKRKLRKLIYKDSDGKILGEWMHDQLTDEQLKETWEIQSRYLNWPHGREEIDYGDEVTTVQFF